MGSLKKSFHLIIISFDHHLFRVEKKGLRQISPQKPSVCDTKCVCVSPHHGTQQEDRDSKRER